MSNYLTLPDDYEMCGKCAGSGKVRCSSCVRGYCSICGGTGYVRCPDCGGTGSRRKITMHKTEADNVPCEKSNEESVTSNNLMFSYMEAISDLQFAVSEAKKEKEYLLDWIDTSDEFTPWVMILNVLEPCISRNELRDWVEKINPDNDESREKLREYVLELQQKCGKGRITSRLIQFKKKCDDIVVYQEICEGYRLALEIHMRVPPRFLRTRALH